MDLFILFIFLFFLSKQNGLSIASAIIGIYIISLVVMFFLSPSVFMCFNLGIFDLLYLSIFYALLVLPWRYMKISSPVDLQISNGDLRLYSIYKKLGFFCLIINLVIFIVLQSVVTDYSAFKNESETVDYLKYIPIPHILSLFVSWFSRSYLFILPFHFFFLKENNVKEAIITLVLSGNYILVGLAGFSRSSTVSYFIIYSILLLYFHKSIDKSTILKYSKYFIIAVVGLSTAFYGITMNRFAGEKEYVVNAFIHQDGLISDPLLNSQASYLSQWYAKTVKWLPQYSTTELTYGVRSLPLLFFILQKIGLSNANDLFLINIEKQFGSSDAGAFMGVCTNLIFDIGFLFTFMFALLYNKIVKKRATSNSSSILSFLPIVILLEIPATGIFSSCMNGMGWHVSLMLYFIYRNIFKK